MIQRGKIPPTPVIGILLFALPALAVIPQFWETRTYEEFRQGELDGLSVTGDGRLVLAPDFEPVFDTGEPIVVSAVADPAGSVYLGTGHDGKVFVVDPDGNSRLLVDLDELDVLAMAVDAGGALFVGTSPDGRVYRVGSDGAAEPFFDPAAVYIWDMVFDREGRLLVATGDEGVIYRVEQDGQSEVLYDSEETHIISLALDAEGNVLAGGDPKGYLYRISDDGRPFVLYDSGMREVHEIAVAADGTIYAAVVDGGADSGAAPDASARAGGGPAGAANVPVTASTPAAQTVVVAGPPSPSGSSDGSAAGAGRLGSASGAILEVRADGSVASIWESTEEMVFSVLPLGDRLLFSTGNRGRVYEYGSAGRTTLVVESTEEQTTRLVEAAGRVFAASSNAGKLFELGDRPGGAGTYTSIVRDTSSVSSWGRLSWEGSGVEIRTRTGNTSVPDPTWSGWAPVADDGAIPSPRARFIQWRAELDRAGVDSPGLSSVTLPYLQQNFRPEIIGVDILRPGVALREAQAATGVANGANNNNRGGISGRVEPAAPTQPPRAVPEPGVQALRWRARDDNDDVLLYSILYRSENESAWKSLVEDLRQTFYTIEADTLPDGMYTMRVVASDIGSNPPEIALEGDRETPPFSIDNTPPAVRMDVGGIEGDRVRLRVEATDATSTLKQAEASVDAGRWIPVFPVDGIVDSTGESFDFLSAPLGPGEHVISFRIYDQNDNVGIGASIVQIP